MANGDLLMGVKSSMGINGDLLMGVKSSMGINGRFQVPTNPH